MIHKTLWQLEYFLFIEQVLCDFGSEFSHRLHFAKIKQVANFKLSIERFGTFATPLFHCGSHLGQSGQTKHRLLFALACAQLFLPGSISLLLFLAGYSGICCGEVHEFLLSSGAHIMWRISKRHSQRIRTIWTGQIWIICIITTGVVFISPLILIRLLTVFTTIFQISSVDEIFILFVISITLSDGGADDVIIRAAAIASSALLLLFLAFASWRFGCSRSLSWLAGSDGLSRLLLLGGNYDVWILRLHFFIFHSDWHTACHYCLL